MARDDDDRPKAATAHEIGQDLSMLSVDECNARIALLQNEIARIEAARAKKNNSLGFLSHNQSVLVWTPSGSCRSV
jgi:uncharacterized small protein (DUF1192 family)